MLLFFFPPLCHSYCCPFSHLLSLDNMCTAIAAAASPLSVSYCDVLSWHLSYYVPEGEKRRRLIYFPLTWNHEFICVNLLNVTHVYIKHIECWIEMDTNFISCYSQHKNVHTDTFYRSSGIYIRHFVKWKVEKLGANIKHVPKWVLTFAPYMCNG